MPTPQDNFRSWFESNLDNKMKAVLIGLEDIGNNCLIEMREPSKRGYKDRTANLRSSTGFVIVYNGEIVRSSGFAQEASAEDVEGAKDGGKKGADLAKEVASSPDCKEGLSLVLVAGMNYAVYVERMGLNVLDSAKLFASSEIKDLVQDLLK